MNETHYSNLAGLTIASHFLYRALHQAANSEFIDALYQDALFDEWPVELSNDKVNRGLELLKAEPELAALGRDYAQLFVGPNALTAAPWGSVYLTEEQITCGESTLAIRDFYQAHGIAIDTGEREPEDHIGIIFSFIAYLTDTALDAQVVEVSHNDSLQALQTFLTEHVLPWAPRFCLTMREAAQTPFYQGISYLAEGTLEQLAQLVDAKYKLVKLYR
ncbi:molecular chaperone [Vibrio taketomensis]|uniref:TorD/DmsD family molecular chaperone n=1 Tax=Vibrio taketomensis TaxID=2572923 RepID=UPI0013894784|nr:molecular chaperone TorD family protein [Vibrio taketomensis]